MMPVGALANQNETENPQNVQLSVLQMVHYYFVNEIELYYVTIFCFLIPLLDLLVAGKGHIK